ncbi:hypothetical protein AMATHDRAFT_73848 [Amanita thiersii Skay4041]|uniref:Uncharacterized protein n=1 Tax=Amanita thiersii Skay4041 TaxID=703135 RepID=A0A2A9NWH7_9AGAR|nr:hypothetical protein AMATHDRAFT_73848 [Amanita thiersii Skay4041]
MPAAFSRLQLAAALLEYDNDPGNPDVPMRRAQDSAIFAHLRRNPAAPPQLSSRRSDYLGVSLPSETGSLGGRESALENRRSRASRGSLDALRNPFGPDDHWDEEEEGNCDEEELEVDLSSWGLDALMPKDKSKSAKGKGKAILSPPHPVSSVRSHLPTTRNDAAPAPRRAINTSRSVSMGGLMEHPNLKTEILSDSKRRRSFGSPLDLVGMEAPSMPMQRPRGASYSAGQSLPLTSQSVPFPSCSARPPSPHPPHELDRRMSVASRFDPRNNSEHRSFSRVSTDSKMALQGRDEAIEERIRTTSGGIVTMLEPSEDNPFAIRPPSPSRLSRFDPKATAHARTFSNVSRGSKMLLEQDDSTQERPERERKFSTTLDLLRPKVLVMPSPLQSVTPEAPPPPQARDGFLLSTDGPPLPPGARSARRSSAMSILDSINKPPIPSNSFTPNPLMSLSLSQITFRNTLNFGFQRDPYSDNLGELPRAANEGEQVNFEPPEIIEHEIEIPLPSPTGPLSTPGPEQSRPAGKLYGKSLIDNLEMRKAQMRNKQRVFTGDQRPSMMSRELSRSSTLIDPASFSRPTTQRQSSYGSLSPQQGVARRSSLNAKPLLNFDDEAEKFKLTSPANRIANSRSVFGVDTLWEREMVKLREIQVQEERDAEERRKREEIEGVKKAKKNKKKGRKTTESSNAEVAVPTAYEDVPRVSIEPPVLPAIQRATRPLPRSADAEESDSAESDVDDKPVIDASAADTGNWFSESDDEGPRRVTGVGPRYPKKVRAVTRSEDVDSEEDLPLSATVDRAMKRATRMVAAAVEDSDEEKPLSTLLQKSKSSVLPPIQFDGPSKSTPLPESDDDDDKPLGLRASRVPLPTHEFGGDDDDDDKPLAFHPEQQRRTQYQMMVQQQQQMMMQAQFQNSMFFNPPSMLGSGFFGPPVMPPMMMAPPIPVPSPPPAHDEAKFGRVDKWRHDVAVEGGH